MAEAVLASNIRKRSKEIDGVLHVSFPRCGSLENYGCAAEEIGAVLRGETDGVFFDGVGVWDIATGFLLVEEAGGGMRYRYIHEGDPRSGIIGAAGTTEIFEELWEFVENSVKQ